jgi:uncharacterized lipoprotein YddW (UPF0748 family)
MAAADNMLRNSSFEIKDPAAADMPQNWTERHHDSIPLEYTGDHHQGQTSGMIPGNGKTYLWRQNVVSPDVRTFNLSAWVKAQDANLSSPGNNASIYGHILYKNQPYETATHFYKDIPAGSYDWQRIEVVGGAPGDAEIDYVSVSINGQLTSGRIFVDEVELTENIQFTPQALLQRKIDDLQSNLIRVGPVDDSVARATVLLTEATSLIQQKPANLTPAQSKWIDACRAVSHDAWAAMYPEAMSDKPVEAQMMYHGIGRDKASTDAYLNLIESMGCNGVYHSLGSWMSSIYHSDVLPEEEGWENFDALTYFIDEAHKRNIKVFGYLAVFYGTSQPKAIPGSIYAEHPEWFASGPNPNMPTFPDPANPLVADFAVRAYVEMATRYKLDGIGLDYIRYPTDSSLNYDENNRKQIKEKFGIDILTGQDMAKDPKKWDKIKQYRAEKVGAVVKKVHDAVKAARPDISIMACLITDPAVAYNYGQNWAVSSKWLDYTSPMNYDEASLDEPILQQQLEISRKNNAVYIPAIGGMPDLHESRTISEWAKHVAMQRKIGGDGIIIYRMGGLDQGVAAFFGNGPFYAKSQFPPPPLKENAQ